MMLSKVKHVIYVVLLLSTSLGVKCFYEQADRTEQPTERNGIIVNDPLSVERPDGNELTMNIKVITSQKAILTVRNSSNRPVYLSYLKGSSKELAYFINYELERRDEATDSWKTYPPSDFGAGFNPLEPGGSIIGRIYSPESGTFRIRLVYMIDANVYEKRIQIANIVGIDNRLAEYDKIADQINFAQISIVSDPFIL